MARLDVWLSVAWRSCVIHIHVVSSRQSLHFSYLKCNCVLVPVLLYPSVFEQVLAPLYHASLLPWQFRHRHRELLRAIYCRAMILFYSERMKLSCVTPSMATSKTFEKNSCNTYQLHRFLWLGEFLCIGPSQIFIFDRFSPLLMGIFF